uniref:J domain-containing protein n=1 Tax=Parastrongyloides trichosuri TaxID=131310 RepID=A0A0N4Z8M3_PARTI
MNVEIDYYKILGVSDKSTNYEIKKAYRSNALKYHPDKNPNGRAMFEGIQKAYKVLSDPLSRGIYDMSRTKFKDPCFDRPSTMTETNVKRNKDCSFQQAKDGKKRNVGDWFKKFKEDVSANRFKNWDNVKSSKTFSWMDKTKDSKDMNKNLKTNAGNSEQKESDSNNGKKDDVRRFNQKDGRNNLNCEGGSNKTNCGLKKEFINRNNVKEEVKKDCGSKAKKSDTTSSSSFYFKEFQESSSFDNVKEYEKENCTSKQEQFRTGVNANFLFNDHNESSKANRRSSGYKSDENLSAFLNKDNKTNEFTNFFPFKYPTFKKDCEKDDKINPDETITELLYNLGIFRNVDEDYMLMLIFNMLENFEDLNLENKNLRRDYRVKANLVTFGDINKTELLERILNLFAQLYDSHNEKVISYILKMIKYIENIFDSRRIIYSNDFRPQSISYSPGTHERGKLISHLLFIFLLIYGTEENEAFQFVCYLIRLFKTQFNHI